MPLILVGLGLYGDENRSRILKLVEDCDVVYLERYTSPVGSIPKYLVESAGSKLRIVSRRDLEDYSSKILGEAVDKKVLIISPGNPLLATTHIQLVIDARRIGIETDVIHGTSAICAALAESGLHIYKLGGISTVVRREKASSERTYRVLRENLERGLHTMLLLEYDESEGYRMSPREALNILLSYDDKGVLGMDRVVVVVCNIGLDSRKVCVCSVGDIISGRVVFDPMDVCIVLIPGDLHFTEEEYLDLLPRCGKRGR